MLRRLERIVPLYWFVSLSIFLLGIAVPSVFKSPGWASAHHLFQSLLFLSFLDGTAPIIYDGWSLEYEMFFYLCVATFLSAGKHAWAIVSCLLSVLVILGFAAHVSGAQSAYFFVTNPMILEFAFGIFVARAFDRSSLDPLSIVAVVTAVVVVAATRLESRAILAGLPASAVVASAVLADRIRRRHSGLERFFERLGNASYSIYLVQVLTISAVCKLVARVSPSLPLDVLIVITTVVTLAVGYGLYLFVERPTLDFFRSVRLRRRGVATALVIEN